MTALRQQRIHDLAQAGTLNLLQIAGRNLNPQEFQTASIEVYRLLVALLTTFIVLEAASLQLVEPSVN